MEKYKLTEKFLTEKQKNNIVGNIKNRYFFRKNDDDFCYKLDAHVNYMLLNKISEIDLCLAEREIKAPYFFCKHFNEIAEKNDGVCGKKCKIYEPKNKKSGVCKNYGYVYIMTEKWFNLKNNLNNETF